MAFTAEAFRSRLRARPFVPFRVVTTTGQTHDIARPDLVMVLRPALIVGTPARDNPAFADQVTRVAFTHVAEVLDLPRSADQADWDE